MYVILGVLAKARRQIAGINNGGQDPGLAHGHSPADVQAGSGFHER